MNPGARRTDDPPHTIDERKAAAALSTPGPGAELRDRPPRELADRRHRAAWARVSRVHWAGPRSSSADSSPAASRASCPGGAERASAMMCGRCASVIRRLRPAPGRSPSPSMPAALNRCSQRRTLFSWQPILAAISATPSPSQLSATIRARSLQSAGACRAPASRRIFLASPSSCGGRARKNFGTGLASTHLADAPATHINLTTQKGT